MFCSVNNNLLEFQCYISMKTCKIEHIINGWIIIIAVQNTYERIETALHNFQGVGKVEKENLPLVKKTDT